MVSMYISIFVAQQHFLNIGMFTALIWQTTSVDSPPLFTFYTKFYTSILKQLNLWQNSSSLFIFKMASVLTKSLIPGKILFTLV